MIHGELQRFPRIQHIRDQYQSPTDYGRGNNIPLGHFALNAERIEAEPPKISPAVDTKAEQEWEQLVNEGQYEAAAKLTN